MAIDKFFFQCLPILVLTVFIFIPGTCQSECNSQNSETGCNTTNPTPQVGERLDLHCPFPCFSSDGFTWFNGSQCVKSNASYFVTEKVTISDIGGRNYSCLCEINNRKECFSICVKPEVSLTFSSNPVMIGSSVNVTCIAVSYPPANPHTSTYAVQHPIGETHNHTYTIMDGVIYEINNVVNNDNGTYKCHVIVNCTNMTMMAGETERVLTVINGSENNTPTTDAAAPSSSTIDTKGITLTTGITNIALYLITSVLV